MDESFYKSPEWRALRARVLARDGSRCTVAQLLGGECRGSLHVHHLDRAEERRLDPDNCGTACASHHPKWEAVRRAIMVQRRPLPPCRHTHRYAHAQRECDARRARALGVAVDPEPLAA